MCGNYPDDFKLKHKNYIGFRINSNKLSIKSESKMKINTVIDYFRILYSIKTVLKKTKIKNIIDIDVFGVGVDLSKR